MLPQFTKIIKRLADKHPELRQKLLTAKIDKTPEKYMETVVKTALMGVTAILILVFLFFSKNHNFALIFFGSLFVSGILLYQINFKVVDIAIIKRGKDIDREVLFAGRFLLIKLNSGQPLINAIVDASKSFGVANKYFKEIVRDIDLGTPLEVAIENAANYSASTRFKKILFNINNAIKIGIDARKSLSSILDEIANEQLIEIQRYGKKLNSLTMFYMLMAIILPSLGMTMAVVIASMLPNLGSMTGILFWLFGAGIVIINIIFINLFRGARPNVNI